MGVNRNLSNNLTKRLISILEYKKVKFISKSELLDIINNLVKSKDPLQLIKGLKKQKKLITIKRDNYLYVPVSSIDKKPIVSEFEVNEIYLGKEIYYIGLLNAFNHYSFTSQISNKLFIFNTKYNLEKKIINFKIKYIRVRKEKMFGITIDKYPYSDIEKTIIDVLDYFKYIDSLEILLQQIKENKRLFNEERLISYAKKLNSIKLLKLIGIITENEKLYKYLNSKNKLKDYTKIRNSGSKKRYKKWKIILI
ncbi:MAG: hypothetical protein V1824_02840 [archaeon]